MKATDLILALGVTLGVSGLAIADTTAAETKPARIQANIKADRPLAADIFRGIELTAEQKQQIKQILDANKPEREDRRAWAEKHHALEKLVQADFFDETAVRQALEAEQSQQLEQRIAQLQVRHQLYQVLTAEQKAQLETRKKDRYHKLREQRKSEKTE